MSLDHLEANFVELAAQLGHRPLMGIEHRVIEPLDRRALEKVDEKAAAWAQDAWSVTTSPIRLR